MSPQNKLATLVASELRITCGVSYELAASAVHKALSRLLEAEIDELAAEYETPDCCAGGCSQCLGVASYAGF